MKKFILFSIIMIILCSCSLHSGIAKQNDYSKNNFKQNGVELIWKSNDIHFSSITKKRLIETFFKVYPRLIKDFNPDAAKTVYFIVDTSFKKYPAATWGDTIRFNPDWFVKNPEDIDVVTHEVVHVMERGSKYNNDTWWMIEGIADYIRYKYGVNNLNANWHLPKVAKNQNYNNGYRVTAGFLNWIENNIKKGAVKEFDKAIRNNNYTTLSWHNITGRNVEDLWKEYVQFSDKNLTS